MGKFLSGSTGSGSSSAVYSDQRALRNWFSGGIANKKILFSGDSTTLNLVTALSPGLLADGTPGRGQYWWPQLSSVPIYCRGINGQSLSGFLAGNGAAGYNLTDILALNCDAYVYSWGINDCRTDNTTTTAAVLQTMLTDLVTRTLSANPNAVIVLRVPNGHKTGAALITGTATAQNCMDRYQTAYRALRGVWPNVLVFDSLAGLYGNVALASGAGTSKLLDADGLHPAAPVYDIFIESVLRLFVPRDQFPVPALADETVLSCPLSLSAVGGVPIWHQSVNPIVLEGPEWYKVYRVNYSDGVAGSYSRWSFTDYKGTLNAAQRDQAWTSGVAAPGLVPGDIISLQNKTGQENTFVVNVAPATQQSTANLQWSGSASLAHPSNIANQAMPSSNWTGYVYRHKYAFCEQMRWAKTAPSAQTFGEVAGAVADPYGISIRFYIQAAAVGSITVQTIGSEPGGDLSTRTWAVTDTIFIPGVTAGALGAAMGMLLTNASFAYDTTNKRVTLTFGGADATIDFRNAVIPQGYVSSAT